MKNISENFPGYITIKPFIDAINSSEIELDEEPESIDAHINLADSYFALWCYGIIPYTQAIKKVKESTSIVLNLNRNHSDAHTLTALLKFSDWDWFCFC